MKHRADSPVPAGNPQGFAGSFGRHCRLLAAAEYATVFSARRVVRGTLFVLHYRAGAVVGDEDGCVRSGPRLGLVIPKKLAHRAVLRNAIKRQARELFRCRRHEFSAFASLDIVLRLAQPADRPPVRIDGDTKARWRSEMSMLLDRLYRREVAG